MHFKRLRDTGRAQTDKLLEILFDGNWHARSELRRRVGLFFGFAKWILIAEGFPIDRRKDPDRRWQYQYRLVPPDAGGRARR